MQSRLNNMQRTLQELTFVIGLATIAAFAFWIRRYRDQWYYSIVPLTWLAHLTLFYICVFMRDAGLNFVGMDFTFWSSLVRLHGVSAMAGIVVAMLIGKLRPYHHE